MPNYFPENNTAKPSDSLERSMAKVVSAMPTVLDYMFGTFYRDFAKRKTLNHGIGPNITFTRGSQATYFDANGTLQTASNDQPRFDHSGGTSLGLLIEEARTNSLRNSQGGGVSAGTLPTNWTATTTQNNVTRTIVGGGTENGLAYLEIQYAGTPTADGGFTIGLDSTSQVVAADGQTWTSSAFCKLQAGSLAGITAVQIGVDGRSAAGSDLSPQQRTMTAFTPTGAALGTQRVSVTRTMTAGAARAFAFILVNYTGGVAIDITLRIAAPQLEQGAFPTSYIPTTSAAVPRSADSAVVTPISSFYNASEGTLFAEASRTHVAKAVSFLLMLKSDESPVASFVNLESGVASPAQQRFQVAGGTGGALLNFADGVANTVYRMAGAYALNDFIGAQNGTLTSADTSGTAPATLDRMTIGMGATTAVPFYGGSQCHIRRIAYYPKRLSNALLQSLTA